MKKLSFLATLLFGIAFNVHSQEISKNALGLRLGDNDGFGAEISYQRGLSENNRLEADLGWRSSNNVDGFKLVGLYQWIWNIDGAFNWYAGAGAGFGTWSVDDRNIAGINVEGDSGAYVLVAGNLGIEYNFDFPLLLTLDIRPELYFNSNDFRDDSFAPDIALGIRYKW